MTSKPRGQATSYIDHGVRLPPVDTIHPFSDKHLDQNFIIRSLNILDNYKLRPIDPGSWHRPCWHSNYGYCVDDKDRIVFVKVFRPQLDENFQTELSTRIFLDKLDFSSLYVPKVLSSHQEDLCLVLEPVKGNNLSYHLKHKPTREKILHLLASALANIHLVTNSREEPGIYDWIVAKSHQYAVALNNHRDILDKFPRLSDILSKPSWMNDGTYSFALGDVTPTHLYWNKHHYSLALVDLELAGKKPEYYDLVYFCHRLLTRFPQLSSSVIQSTVSFLLTTFEEIILPVNTIAFRHNVLSLLGVRMLGGLVDCLVIEDGTEAAQHLRAWETYLKIRTVQMGESK